MKKAVVVVLSVILGLFILTVGGCTVLLGIMDYRNKNYWDYADAIGEIETKYTALGSYNVEYAEFEAENELYKKYEVWYPAEMKSSENKYPLVIMANGTGIKASQYQEVFKRLASWGFIVAGNEDENSCKGTSSAETLDYILKLNKDKDSIFCGKADTGNIGIAGHSQGGVGAINAVAEQENGTLYKAAFAASCTSRYHADELNKSGGGWSIDISKVNIPIFMVAGTGFMDSGNCDEYTAVLPEGKAQGICPLWWLKECYDNAHNSAVIARRKDKDHGDMLRCADGYMTAWFMYYLKGDESAGTAFFGEKAEILTNGNWQDVKTNI